MAKKKASKTRKVARKSSFEELFTNHPNLEFLLVAFGASLLLYLFLK